MYFLCYGYHTNLNNPNVYLTMQVGKSTTLHKTVVKLVQITANLFTRLSPPPPPPLLISMLSVLSFSEKKSKINGKPHETTWQGEMEINILPACKEIRRMCLSFVCLYCTSLVQYCCWTREHEWEIPNYKLYVKTKATRKCADVQFESVFRTSTISNLLL